MKQLKRREFLKTTAGVAAGAHRRPDDLGEGCPGAVEQHAGKGREAARAALEALRAGRRRPVSGQRQEVHGEDRHRSARRRRGLGGRAAESGRRRQHRRGPGHHPGDQRRCQSVSRQAARRAPTSAHTSARSTAASTRSAIRICARTARSGSAVPLGVAGVCMVYRESHVKAAGFNKFPRDTDGFLKLCKALKDKGTPPGFALGNATGDGNGWCHWLLWAFGGKLVDASNKVVIDSPETLKALEYAKEMYGTFVPGHAVVARSEQQQGVPRRADLTDEQRHLDLLRGQDLEGSEGRRAGRGHQSRELCRSVRSASRASSSCSSTR